MSVLYLYQVCLGVLGMLGVLSLGRQGISVLYMYQVLPLSDMFVLYLYQKCLRVVFVQVQVYMVGNYLCTRDMLCY